MALVDLFGVQSKADEYIARRAAAREPNAINGLCDQLLADAVRGKVDNASRVRVTTVTIAENLSHEQENRLVSLYPSLHLQFSKSSNNDHGFAAASRRCETAVCLQYIGYNPRVGNFTDGRDDFATDVGGNYSRHIVDGNYGIHSCCPMLDDRDVQRYRTRRELLKKVYANDKDKIHVLESSKEPTTLLANRIAAFLNSTRGRTFSNDWCCLRRFEQCDRTSRYAILIHSNYDIPLKRLGDAMRRKKIAELYGTFIYDDKIFYRREGFIEDLDCYFSYSEDNKNITFAFKNDSSLVYIHKTRVYLSYLLVNTFVDSTGTCRFVLELLENRGGIQFFKVTRVPFIASKRFSPLVHCLWFKSLEGKVKVTFPVVDVERMRRGCSAAAVEKKVMFLDKELVDTIMGHAMVATESKFKPTEIMAFIESYTHRIFVGDDVVSRLPSLTFSEKLHMALAVYVEVYKRKYDSGKMLQYVLECIQYDRALMEKGWFGRVMSSPSKLLSVFKAAMPPCLFGTMLGSFYLMAFNAAASPIDGYKFIEDCAHFTIEGNSNFTTFTVVRAVHKVMDILEDIFVEKRSQVLFDQLEIIPPKILAPVASEMVIDPTIVTRQILLDNFNADVKFKAISQVVDDCAVVTESPRVLDGSYSQRSILVRAFNRLFGRSRCMLLPPDEVGEIELAQDALTLEEDCSEISMLSEVSPMLVCFEDVYLAERIHRRIERYSHYVQSEVADDVYKSFVVPRTRSDYDTADLNFISRAEFKLREILDVYFLSGVKNALDLCAGPGGFVKCLLQRARDQVVVHFYKNADADCVMAWEKLRRDDGYCKLSVVDAMETDLTTVKAVEEVTDVLGRTGLMFDLVTADGARHDDRVDKETINYPLIFGEVLVAEKFLVAGGSVVLKTFGFYDHSSLSMLSRFLVGFEKYYLHRSSYATPFSREVYVIAFRYRGWMMANVVRRSESKISRIYHQLRQWQLRFEEGLYLEYRKFLVSLSVDFVEMDSKATSVLDVNDHSSVERQCCDFTSVVETDVDDCEEEQDYSTALVTAADTTQDRSVGSEDSVISDCYVTASSRSGGPDNSCDPIVAKSCKGNDNVGRQVGFEFDDVIRACDHYFVAHVKTTEDFVGSLAFDSVASPFSNFSRCTLRMRVPFDDVVREYLCVEHAFLQAELVFLNRRDMCKNIRTIRDCRCARRKMKDLVTGRDKEIWDRCKYEVMMKIQEEKYAQNAVFREALIRTDGLRLIYAARDVYWGGGVPLPEVRCTGKFCADGFNRLGELVMSIRCDLLGRSTYETKSEVSFATVSSGEDDPRNDGMQHSVGDKIVERRNDDAISAHFSDVGKLAREPVSVVELRDVCCMDVKGDGNCLYYALMMGDCNDAFKLRQLLEGYLQGMGNSDLGDIEKTEAFNELSGWGGVNVLKLFSRFYRARVEVVDLRNGSVYKFGDDWKYPSICNRLGYTGNHYVVMNNCTACDAKDGDYPRQFNYAPLDVVALMDTLDQLLTSNNTRVSRLVSLLMKSSSLVYVDDVDKTYYSHVFYNAVANYCCFHRDCEQSRLSRFLKNLVNNGYKKTLYVLCSNFDVDFQVLQQQLTAYHLKYLLLDFPWLVDNDYTLLIVPFDMSIDNDMELCTAVRLMTEHNKECEECRNMSFTRCISSMWCNPVTNTFFSCAPVSVDNVLKSKELPLVDRVYSLTLMTVEKFEMERWHIMEYEGYFSIPVAVDDSGQLLKEKCEVVSVMLAEHFAKMGDVRVMGLRKTSIIDVKFVVDILSNHCDKLYVEVEPTQIAAVARSEFLPKYVQTVVDDDIITNAMVEAREMWKVTVTSIINNVKILHERSMTIAKSQSRIGRLEFTNNKPDYGLMDLATGKFIVKPRERYQKYSRAYNGKNLISIEDCYVGEKFQAGRMQGYASVTKEMRVVNSDVMYSRVADVDLSELSFDHLRITLIEGVPGCGKSTYILNEHKFSDVDCEHVVLTATKETAEDMKRRVSQKYGVSVDDPIMKKRYRTCDSFLMHYKARSENIDTLWVDEGLMKHFGEIMWCVYLSGARNLRICGDRAQIPFINRNGSIFLQFSDLEKIKAKFDVRFLSRSYRCPADVVCYLNRIRVYTQRVTTINTVRRSLAAVKIACLNDIKFSDHLSAVVLTFTQQEKLEIITMMNKDVALKKMVENVFTVHEYQGKQTAEVVLVRMQPKDIAIYSSSSHCLVAVTRHTVKFVYYTVKEDQLYVECRKLLSQSDLDEVVETLKGGGVLMGAQDQRQYPLTFVEPRESKTFDKLKQNRQLREFVEDNAGNNVVPFTIIQRPLEVPVIEDPFICYSSVDDPISALQLFVDVVFPGASAVCNEYDREIFQSDRMIIPKDRVVYSTFVTDAVPKYACLTSRLRTNCPANVVTTQKQVMKAYFQRNGNVPELSGENDEDALVSSMVQAFEDTYIYYDTAYRVFATQPVDINVDSIEEWLRSQPEVVRQQIYEDDEHIFDKDLRTYAFELKRLPKPKLEVGNDKKYLSPQTIAHHCKKINALFCPVVKEIKRRLISVLRSDKLVFTDMSVEDFERVLTYRLPKHRFKRFRHMLEVDFSKYDKSQGRVALKFELAMLRRLGFPPALLATWSVMHVYTRLWAPSVKFKAEVCFQRKSGDAMTFFGNTMFLMAVMAYSFRLKESFCLFSGDDSLIFSRFALDYADATSRIAFNFNLESKLLSFNTPYFCSKFLIMSPYGRWVMIPDPVKLIVKLGRRDLVSFEHVAEYHVSLKDNLKVMLNAFYYYPLSYAVCNRYSLHQKDLSFFFRAIASLIFEDQNFSSLYYLEPGQQLNPYRSKLPDLEF
nr:hypothetical protein [Shayang virga-like virus 1]